jgi:hypothetical protein
MVVSMASEENKKLGYIQLFRSMKQWGWYKEPLTCHLFIHCLLSANHKDNMYKGVLVKKGSFLTSRKLLAEETGLSERNVRTALTRLKSTNELTIEKNQKGTIITVNNFAMYQEATKKVTTKRPANDQQVTTNNNDNNENNVVVVSNDHNNDSFFMEFWNAYGKRGYINDVYAYWLTLNVDEELQKQIVHGAKKYTEETDVKKMVYPRTFLMNQVWKNYPLKEKQALSEEELEYYKSLI